MSTSVPPVEPIPADGYEPVSEFGALLIGYLAPWMTLHMAWLLDSIGVVVDPIYTLVSDVGEDDGETPTIGTYFNNELVTEGFQPGYGALLNPLICPTSDLPYLAQFAGVQVPAGSSDALSRSMIMTDGILGRGTEAAVIAAAQHFLTGDQSVTIVPRTYTDGSANAGWFLLIVNGMELSTGVTWQGSTYPWASASQTWTSSSTITQLTAAVNAVKFSGLMWTLVVSGTYVWSQAAKTWATEGALTWQHTASTNP